ncbi:hypothetical protein JVU11DRAFT_6504 [Chiua virens]|nr:hypothetical protein JVU11DRAFT_6504 [Chiua virens]
MHVKEQVKEFVHDVKRKFSKKHMRDSTCPTCAGRHDHDSVSSYSSADTIRTMEDSSSSSVVSSRPGTPERGRFSSFLHPRIAPKKHNYSVLYKVRRQDGKRHRLFSAPAIPSSRADASYIASHRHAATEPSSTPKGSMWKARAIQDVPDATSTSSSVVRHYPNVIDISAPAVEESTRSFHDSSCQTPPHFDTELLSETSGALVNSTPQSSKSVSDPDWRLDNVVLGSDENSVPPLSSPPSLDRMAHLPVVPDTPRHEEITLTHSPRPANLNNPTVASSPVVSQALPAVSPASAPASPASVYIPRLTAPSMFLPIPNVRLVSPPSYSLVWWLASKWSAGTRFSLSVSLPDFGDRSPLHLQSAMVLPLYSNFILSPTPSPKR